MQIVPLTGKTEFVAQVLGASCATTKYCLQQAQNFANSKHFPISGLIGTSYILIWRSLKKKIEGAMTSDVSLLNIFQRSGKRVGVVAQVAHSKGISFYLFLKNLWTLLFLSYVSKNS